jgi:hypothetical protein
MKEIDARYMPIYQCRMWARAVLRTGYDVLAVRHLEKNARENQQVSEHFFLIALLKLNDWCDVLQAVEPELIGACSTVLHAVTADVKDVRDMREHDDEYLQGGGFRKDQYWVTREGWSADASSAIVDAGQYLIGGRVSVQEFMGRANAFLEELQRRLPDMGLDWV